MNESLTRSWHFRLCMALLLGAASYIGWSASRGVREAPHALGNGPAYKTVAEIPVQHRGRVKPLETLAALELKEIYGREELKIVGSEGKIKERWTALGAFLDWSARPQHWDDQEIILIDMFDYLGFKQVLLAEPVKDALRSAAGRDSTSEKDRQAIERIVQQDAPTEKDLKAVLATAALADKDREALMAFAAKLSEGRKWVAPADLESARVMEDGKLVAYPELVKRLIDRRDGAGMNESDPQFDAKEKKYLALGERLLRYQGFRDGNTLKARSLDIPIVPRPLSQPYLDYTAKVLSTVMARGGSPEAIPDLDLDVTATLASYLQDIQSVSGYMADLRDGKQKPPGQDPQFDKAFTKWLRETSSWVPLRVLLSSDDDSLAAAGFEKSQVEALRTAYGAFKAAEVANPGEAEPAAAERLAASLRAVGQANSSTKYPQQAEMTREAHFNHLAPFAKAPWAYGSALVLLLISLGVQATPGSWVDRLGQWIYRLGMGLFVLGLALEVYGFYLRVMISGWAPVTNMYETVVWVAFGAALIGIILELIYPRKYAATAATGTAFLATLLAANVPLLDPNISSLQPVLRDNYWLTVHVITIVSSYAAFSLAMGLGFLGLHYYLGATYRHDARLAELALPFPIGLAVAALGLALWLGGTWFGPFSSVAYWIGAIALFLGSLVGLSPLFALLGEFANRNWRLACTTGLDLMSLGAIGVVAVLGLTPPSWWPEQLPTYFVPGTVGMVGMSLAMMSLLGGRSRAVLSMAGSAGGAATFAMEDHVSSSSSQPARADAAQTAGGRGGVGAGVATLERPSVAQIRSRLAQERPPLDPRTQAIQWTMLQIKPLSNFIYRAMQVGVLLVAAGTILGGVWADVSWGRFWGWDAKEVWALITLLLYLVPLHGRFAGWVSTFGLVAASVFCYMSVLMAWYGVNFVLNVGLHTYGFTEGGGQYLVCAVATVVMSAVVGAGYRRWVGSRNPIASV